MKKNLRNFLSLALAFAMTFALAVPAMASEAGTTEASTEAVVTEEAGTLVAGYDAFSEKFSAFFGKTAYDVDVTELVGQALIGLDRTGNPVLTGIEGATVDYNGTDYVYDGIADLAIVQNEDGTVDYNVTMREDIVFSDGVPMTIDDVIFTMYVYSDPSYDGSTTFYAMPVVGMADYRAGVNSEIYAKYEALGTAIKEAGIANTDFANWTKEQQDAFWVTALATSGPKFAATIVNYIIDNVADVPVQPADVYDNEVALGMANYGYGEVDEAGVLTKLPSGATFDLANGVFPTLEDFWTEIHTAYGDNFSAEDGINYETVPDTMPIEDYMLAEFISAEGPKDPDAGEAINSIAGIKKTGEYSMTVTTSTFDATSVYNFGMIVAPLHYYGDPEQYNYEGNQFGFPKGDLSIIREKTTVPLGAGAYKFLSYENGVVSLEANPLYWEGEPKTKYIRLQEVLEADKLSSLTSGAIDVANPSFSLVLSDSIKGYNTNGELTGEVITSSFVENLGYGYIGISANNVNVGGVIDSPASKDLRKAFATLLAVYRETTISSYYGEGASVIQYPISNTSWAAPRPNDEGYQEAFSVNAQGEPIYTAEMTEEERYAAALEASIGFFKAAGYTWDEASGKFTAAPEGAEMSYEAIVPGMGTASHPSYGILTNVKTALETVGITLDINDPADANVLWNAIEAGEAEMWCAAWEATPDPDMYQVYHSSNAVGEGGTDSNSYYVRDAQLDELIMAGRGSADQTFRKATYKAALDIVVDWAVEVPIYQRQNVFIFSTERLNTATLTPDTTPYWDWTNDIELLELN